MKGRMILGTLMMVAPVLLLVARAIPGNDVPDPANRDFKVLQPISHGNLTIFPVVASKVHDTSDFLTLDEGIRSGEVVVTEVGKMHTMIRRSRPYPHPVSDAEVNRLVLVNNSKRPLILLAGEIVTGGKQDRIVGKDRIIPPESDPVDLSVFCVEHGRWTESSAKFDVHNSFMAQPSVRKEAMGEKDQQKVWAAVQAQNAGTVANVITRSGTNASGGTTGENGTSGGPTTNRNYDVAALPAMSSLAKVRENTVVQDQIKSITDPMEKSFQSVIK